MSEESREEPRGGRKDRARLEERAERRERRQEQELRSSVLRKIAGFLGFADLMAVLMVASTGFSAFATWRTATIARELLMSSERPYFGVEDVKLDGSRPNDPRVYVDFRNFGHIPADDVRLRGDLFIDNKPLGADRVDRNAGIMSPDVPHHVFLHLPGDRYREVMAGRAALLAQVSARYQNSGGLEFCYRERFAFKSGSGTFEIAGGSSRCDQQSAVTP